MHTQILMESVRIYNPHKEQDGERILLMRMNVCKTFASKVNV